LIEDVIVLGELHQDLYYETEYYEEIVQKVTDQLINFIHYNPDDLNRELLRKAVMRGIAETPKKVLGFCYFKRGGNGNNSSEFLSSLGAPTKLMSVIGRGSEWMYPELKNLGINTDYIFQIDEITPVSTIIRSKFTTKIHLVPNLKNKMSFKGIIIKDEAFENTKIIFSTPIAEKFIHLFERGSKLGLITAFNIERQKIQSLEELSKLIKKRYDIFFLNLKDALIILDEKLPIEYIDQHFKQYAYIRVYTAGSKGSYVITDNFSLSYPGIEVKAIVDRTGAGDCYAAGFLTKIYNLIENKYELHKLIKNNNAAKLKEILKICIEYASYAAIYKITKQTIPNKNEMDKFVKEFRIN
jgi:sugar/nucleoside kinase (ribokinase family)